MRIVHPNGEPIHVPDGWHTVELSQQEIQDEADTWCGKVDLDHVALHMLQRLGVRMDPQDGRPVPICFTQIEQPVLVYQDDESLTVHQGPRPLAS